MILSNFSAQFSLLYYEEEVYILLIYTFTLISIFLFFKRQVKSLKVADIIHGALRRFTDGLGQLWCSLADYYIRGGHFEKARDVYEEAIQTVMTVRDFGEVSVTKDF